MAERLPDGNMQALQQFVNQSPWDPLPVRRRIAHRLYEAITPAVWVIDDVSFPKCGAASLPGVTMSTGRGDAFPLETMQLMRFKGERWQLFGKPVDTRKEFGPAAK